MEDRGPSAVAATGSWSRPFGTQKRSFGVKSCGPERSSFTCIRLFEHERFINFPLLSPKTWYKKLCGSSTVSQTSDLDSLMLRWSPAYITIDPMIVTLCPELHYGDVPCYALSAAYKRRFPKLGLPFGVQNNTIYNIWSGYIGVPFLRETTNFPLAGALSRQKITLKTGLFCSCGVKNIKQCMKMKNSDRNNAESNAKANGK